MEHGCRRSRGDYEPSDRPSRFCLIFELRLPLGVPWIVLSERCGHLGEWNGHSDLGNQVCTLA